MDGEQTRMVEAVVEIPRGGVVKRRADGSVDFVSPVPCPWNYGSAPDLPGGDGDPQDAIVLGRRRPRGERVRLPVRAIVRFVDAGKTDDKLVLSDAPLGRVDRWALRAFFTVYARFKRVLNRARGARERTAFVGLE